MWKLNAIAILMSGALIFVALSAAKKITMMNTMNEICQANCGIARSMVAQDICFCMTEKGWMESR